MKMSIHTDDIQEMIFERDYAISDPGAAEDGVYERTIALDSKAGKVSYTEIFFDGMHIGYGDMRLKAQTSLFFESDFETVEMHFDLVGDTETVADNRQILTTFASNEHNIVYVPGIKGKVAFAAGSSRMLEINISPRTLKSYLGHAKLFDEFVKRIEQQSPSLISKHNQSITPEMMRIISGIIDCKRKGVFKRMFIEAKVIELMLLQMEQFATHTCNTFCTVRPADVEKLHHARELMSSDPGKTFSLRKLALEVGTNEFTLKKGFKDLFGTTVFGMLTEIRMLQARQQLIESDLTIAKISEQAGYSHQSHFHSAFKRYFGMPPGQCRYRGR